MEPITTDAYPRGTPRHHRAERLRCPRNGAEVTGHFCLRHCSEATEQGEGALYFSCRLLDEEAGPHGQRP